MVNEQELIELLRKCTQSAEHVAAAFETGCEITQELKDAINKANELLQKLDQDKAFKEELPEWNIKRYEPSLDELLDTLPMRRFSDITKCFEACKSKSDITKVIKAAPPMFGTFWAEYDDHSFIIVNRYFDDELYSDWDEEYWYDYPEDWEED